MSRNNTAQKVLNDFRHGWFKTCKNAVIYPFMDVCSYIMQKTNYCNIICIIKKGQIIIEILLL